jgi:hypothetical protein
MNLNHTIRILAPFTESGKIFLSFFHFFPSASGELPQEADILDYPLSCNDL